MAKITLNDVAAGYNRQKINDNFSDIENELQNKVLYRDNPVGEPNHMESDLDMNSNFILNVQTDVTDPGSLITVGAADTRFVNVTGDTMTGALTVQDDITGQGTLTVTGKATLNDELDVASSTHLQGSLVVDGSTTINDNANVTGDVTIGGDINSGSVIDVNAGVAAKSTLTVDGKTTINNDLDVNGRVVATGTVQGQGLDANGSKVENVATAVESQDAVNFQQLNNSIINASSGLIARLRETRKTASAGQTVFNLSDVSYGVASNSVQVYVNGVAQVAGIDFEETDSTTITFFSGLQAGDVVDVYVNESTTNVTDSVFRSQLKQGIVKVDLLSALQALGGRFADDAAYLMGRSSVGDGGEGHFRWDGSDLSSTLVTLTAATESVDAGTDTITDTAHGLVNGDGVTVSASVNGLTANELYWVVGATTDTYQLSTTFGGAVVDLTGTTNFTTYRLLDPLQGVYAASDRTGAGGAWVRDIANFVNLEMFGAVGDGVVDDTVAVSAMIAMGFPLNLGNFGSYLIDTFSHVLDDGTSAAILLTSDLIVRSSGATIKSNTSSVSNSILGIDGTSGVINLDVRGVGFTGENRYRAINASPTSEFGRVEIINVETDKQSILLQGVADSLHMDDVLVGSKVEAATAASPQIDLSIVVQNGYSVTHCEVRTGSEAGNDAFRPRQIPHGGVFAFNTHICGNANIEGFDIDGVGRFAKIIGNRAIGSNFEIKTGVAGYEQTADIVFSDNYSERSWTASFRISSSIIGSNNIAYDPQSWGLFLADFGNTSSAMELANVILQGFKIIYAGTSTFPGPVRVAAGDFYVPDSITIRDLFVEIDPLWAEDNPGSRIPEAVIDMAGDLKNVVFDGGFLAPTDKNHVVFRPTTRAQNIQFRNMRLGETGDSCFDISDVDRLTIENIEWPTVIADRALRLSLCEDVIINTRDVVSGLTTIRTAITTGSNTFVKINNLGEEAAGAGNPPSADRRWTYGLIVRNTDDSTAWLRVSESGTPSLAWLQIA